MCGFTGCHTPHDASLMDAALLARMTGALAHRGPDDVTLHRQPGLAFGFNRLAIIDLAGGRQPIRNEDGDIVLVCNGEIFNHRQLREELKARGHRFRAEVDVEVMVHLYEEFGLGFLDRISGQFAFALYDARRRICCWRAIRPGSLPCSMYGGAIPFCSAPRSRRSWNIRWWSAASISPVSTRS